MNLFTQDNFQAWLDTQPGNREFTYLDNCGCLIASWLQESGICPGASCGAMSFVGPSGAKTKYPDWLSDISLNAAQLCRFTVDEFRAYRP